MEAWPSTSRTCDSGTHEFLKELIRLVEVSPSSIAAVFGELIKTYDRGYDYENVVKTLIARLAQLGQKPAALKYCEQLRDVDGVPELFVKLRTGG